VSHPRSALLCAVSFVCAVGCASASDEPAADPTAERAAQPTPDVTVDDEDDTSRDDTSTSVMSDGRAAEASVLDVRATGCGPRETFGNAALVGDGHAVTAAHVVAGADEVTVTDGTGEQHVVEVVLFDPKLDVALVSTPAAIGVPLEPAQRNAEAGDLGVIGLARHTDGTLGIRIAPVEVLRHVSVETTDIYLDAPVTRPGFEVVADIDPGDSGAVVVIDGDAAGVIWARSTERNGHAWAVDLPDVVRDRDQRDALTEPVDTGRCVGTDVTN
jgi:hypothetical protein